MRAIIPSPTFVYELKNLTDLGFNIQFKIRIALMKLKCDRNLNNNKPKAKLFSLKFWQNEAYRSKMLLILQTQTWSADRHR